MQQHCDRTPLKAQQEVDAHLLHLTDDSHLGSAVAAAPQRSSSSTALTALTAVSRFDSDVTLMMMDRRRF